MDVAPPAGGGVRPVNEETESRIDLRQAELEFDLSANVLNAVVPG